MWYKSALKLVNFCLWKKEGGKKKNHSSIKDIKTVMYKNLYLKFKIL